MIMTVEELAGLILEQTQARLREKYPTSPQWEWERTEVIPGPKYTKINRGPEHNMSGFLMIENATGRIFGIKGYGQVHRGHYYGTLDTAGQWFWGNYGPERLTEMRPGECVPIPDSALYNRMRKGHRRRTRHELDGELVYDGSGIWHLERSCCEGDDAA
jgi:hypothetical protein